jgi:DNA-binding GntR family transcriptional regulator
MDERIKQKSLPEHIAEDLERKIIAGTLRPGQRIVEQALCRTFGVSRSPVREAFQMLESQGFLVREPRKGVSVARVSPQEAEQIYRIRACLEGLAVSLAVEQRTPALLASLKKLHQQMVEAAARRRVSTYQALNEKFHELLLAASGSPRLIQLIRSFDKQTVRYRLAVTNAPGWMPNSAKIHEAIIASFETGDAEAAERLRRESILSQAARFPEIFKGEGDH